MCYSDVNKSREYINLWEEQKTVYVKLALTLIAAGIRNFVLCRGGKPNLLLYIMIHG